MPRKSKVIQFIKGLPLNFTQINTSVKRISPQRVLNNWVAYTVNFKNISIETDRTIIGVTLVLTKQLVHLDRRGGREVTIIKLVLTKTIGRDHLTGNLIHLGVIRTRPSRHAVRRIDDLLRRTSTEGYHDLRKEIFLGVERTISVILRRLEKRHTTRGAAWHDRNLTDRVVIGYEYADNSVSSLMVRHEFLLAHRVLHVTLRAYDDALVNIFHNLLRDSSVTILYSPDGTLIEKVGEIGTGETSRLFRDVLETHVWSQLLVPRVNTQNLEASLHTRKSNLNLSIEATGSQ